MFLFQRHNDNEPSGPRDSTTSVDSTDAVPPGGPSPDSKRRINGATPMPNGQAHDYDAGRAGGGQSVGFVDEPIVGGEQSGAGVSRQPSAAEGSGLGRHPTTNGHTSGLDGQDSAQASSSSTDKSVPLDPAFPIPAHQPEYTAETLPPLGDDNDSTVRPRAPTPEPKPILMNASPPQHAKESYGSQDSLSRVPTNETPEESGESRGYTGAMGAAAGGAAGAGAASMTARRAASPAPGSTRSGRAGSADGGVSASNTSPDVRTNETSDNGDYRGYRGAMGAAAGGAAGAGAASIAARRTASPAPGAAQTVHTGSVDQSNGVAFANNASPNVRSNDISERGDSRGHTGAMGAAAGGASGAGAASLASRRTASPDPGSPNSNRTGSADIGSNGATLANNTPPDARMNETSDHGETRDHTGAMGAAAGGAIGAGAVGAAAQRAGSTRSRRTGSADLGSTFVNGAALANNKAPEGDPSLHARRASADEQLGPKEKAVIAKEEKLHGRQLSKIVKSEAKTEKAALQVVIKELDQIQRIQKQAVKDELVANTKFTNALKEARKAEITYMAALETHQRCQSTLKSHEEALENSRRHARDTTEMLREKMEEVENVQLHKQADDRERAIKIKNLAGEKQGLSRFLP
ncbi:hypothetical protein FA95DRAFT_1562910 [Auriscalpium vulgare]|uniref:Uncharacterized protein n=1 Tax=Auriscalpium vulgare TaxID=40419 RepID=A0ACB8RI78_9AGAM|nr:hypothetical protein FA95DRAFT_1562910 [Auriscalpium vulgare]